MSTRRPSVTVAGYVLPWDGRYNEYRAETPIGSIAVRATFDCWAKAWWLGVEVAEQRGVGHAARAATKKIDQMRAALAGEKGRKR